MTPRRRSPRAAPLIWLPLAALASTGCARVEQAVEMFFDDTTPRERYEIRLQRAGLAGTAVVQEWLAVAERALAAAPLVTAPHAEQGYLPPAEPAALSLRVRARRGQAIALDIELTADSAALLFLDAWQVVGDSTATFRHVVSADSGARSLGFEPRQDGDYVLRVQPELLRGGRFRLELRLGPTLAFPVQGARESDIGSDFGDPRDGGARDHHGIDIFAPRGTPVLAAAVATVRRVNETPRGGKVVWLRDDRGQSLYYAHLDSQAVTQGMRVHEGDTVGFVGNTGNARTTPPHLHFGVYSRGPVNPYWFVHRPDGTAPLLAADTTLLGGWVRTPRSGVTLRASPGERVPGLAELPQHTAARVLAATGAWFRIRLPDGSTGFLPARQVESASAPVLRTATAGPMPILARPVHPAAAEDLIALARDDSVAVLGRFGEFLMIRGPGGRPGWVAQPP